MTFLIIWQIFIPNNNFMNFIHLYIAKIIIRFRPMYPIQKYLYLFILCYISIDIYLLTIYVYLLINFFQYYLIIGTFGIKIYYRFW